MGITAHYRLVPDIPSVPDCLEDDIIPESFSRILRNQPSEISPPSDLIGKYTNLENIETSLQKKNQI